MADPKFIDLSYTKAEKKEEAKEYATAPMGPGGDYPWGLCLHLEKRELDKLGITDLPGVGDEFHLSVIAKVTQVSQQSGTDRDDSKSVALQITMICVNEHERAKQESDEAKKYGAETPAKESQEQRSIMAKAKG